MSVRLRSLAAMVAALSVAAAGQGWAGPRESGLQDAPSAVSVISREELADTQLSMDVLSQLNAVRADPQAFAGVLRGPQPRLRGIGGGDRQEAAAFLDRLNALPPLTYSPALSDAALFHARDIGSLGLTSHTGSQGATMGGRMRARGLTPTLTAEELSFGQSSGIDVILQLVVDKGVAGKPHRADLFNPVFTQVGVGCARHKRLGRVCVINLSNGFMRPPPSITLTPTAANTAQFNCPAGQQPTNADTLRAQLGDFYTGSDVFPAQGWSALASANAVGQGHLAQELGANPGRYDSLGDPPWMPPANGAGLPAFCAPAFPLITVATTSTPAPPPASDWSEAWDADDRLGYDLSGVRLDIGPPVGLGGYYAAPSMLGCSEILATTSRPSALDFLDLGLPRRDTSWYGGPDEFPAGAADGLAGSSWVPGPIDAGWLGGFCAPDSTFDYASAGYTPDPKAPPDPDAMMGPAGSPGGASAFEHAPAEYAPGADDVPDPGPM